VCCAVVCHIDVKSSQCGVVRRVELGADGGASEGGGADYVGLQRHSK